MNLHDLTLVELGAGLAAKRFSSREVVDGLLARIEKADGKLHAFTEVYTGQARALADAADTARASGFPLGPLHGLPVAYKDLCDIAGNVGTGGSKMFERRVATETSNTVERLTAAGMVPLGKLHMVEFAFGGWGTNPLMGAPWNPWDLGTHHVPGGSSSGTGVAVAARLTPAGIGSDTGGSVRIPSAFNGLVGFKVTFGRIGLSGTMLLSWSFDSIGPMARSVEDCALLLNALAAPDSRDPTTLDQPLEDFTEAVRPGSIEGLRIAMPDTRQLPNFMHADVTKAWQAAGRTFESLGATVEAVRLPDWWNPTKPPRPRVQVETTMLLMLPALIEALERVKNSFNSYPLDRLAIAGAVASVEDEDYFRASCAQVIETRARLVADLQALGFEVLPSAANFIFARHPTRDGAELTAELRRRAIIVRHFKAARIDQFMRITVGTDAQCAILVAALREILAG
mgnify:CR=1 FL=1